MKTQAAVAWKAGAPLTIETVDLQGPKIRIERFANGPVELVSGAPSIRIDCALIPFLVPIDASDEVAQNFSERMKQTGVFGCEAGRSLAARRRWPTTSTTC